MIFWKATNCYIWSELLSIISKLLNDLNWELLELHIHLLGPLISPVSCGMGSIEYVLLVTCVIFLSLGGHHQYLSLFHKCPLYDSMICPDRYASNTNLQIKIRNNTETALSWKYTHTSIAAKSDSKKFITPFSTHSCSKHCAFFKPEIIFSIRLISPPPLLL